MINGFTNAPSVTLTDRSRPGWLIVHPAGSGRKRRCWPS
jgi:hypothetical protein